MKSKREPYVFQIGFDFGTAYSKCVIRDLNTDDAFVYIPKFAIDDDMPFLFSSAVHFENGVFSTYQSKSNFYSNEDQKLNYLKLALEGIINGRNQDILEKYKISAHSVRLETNQFIFLSTVFFLAKSISDIIKYIKLKFKNYGENEHDMIAINMCIPVYCANEKKIESVFSKALNCAWKLSSHLKMADSILIQDLAKLTKQSLSHCTESEEYCYIYPEVSANMHGFVRSRASKPGTYLFSDIGAGTVDQCIFIFDKSDGIEKVAYISADVFPLGSSVIERKALSSFLSSPQDKQDTILSSLNKLTIDIKKELANNQSTISDCIDIMSSKPHDGTPCAIRTKYTLLYILQLIKENRELFDSKPKKSAAPKKTTHLQNQKKISPHTSKFAMSDNAKSNIIDDLVNMIIESTIDIKNELDSKTKLNFKKSIKKIPNLNNIKLIFGGGGDTPIPYRQGVQYAFFSNDNHKLPESITLPSPHDLDAESHWIPRLSVAYGLSFNRFDLHKIILPYDIKPLILTHSPIYRRQMTSKDEC